MGPLKLGYLGDLQVFSVASQKLSSVAAGAAKRHPEAYIGNSIRMDGFRACKSVHQGTMSGKVPFKSALFPVPVQLGTLLRGSADLVILGKSGLLYGPCGFWGLVTYLRSPSDPPSTGRWVQSILFRPPELGRVVRSRRM